ncbi:hypothetical protein B566_EDAN018696 [Ephemera danica]|nr:hypothetical protein B566_EDAN018696 [Ephemera danica]
MRLRPMAVVMISTLTAKGADTTLRALELGAVDFVCKPRADLHASLQEMAQDITQKIRVAAKARVRRLQPPLAQAAATGAQAKAEADAGEHWPVNGKVVFIGASTGGTEATRELLERLPAAGPPIVVAQHMPAGFTQSYAQRLDSQLPWRVLEARDGMRLRGGHVYIAPGGLHTTVERSGCWRLRVTDGPPVNRHKPSVEVLFRSAARTVGTHALGVMLTGMGADGALAMREMRDAGAHNFCQDEASCVVFGMPREAIAAGAAHEVLPPAAIAERLARFGRAAP